jgi:hypothetical protein
MKTEVSILMALGRSSSWILKAAITALKGPVLLAKLLIEILERIFEYSFGWIL